MFACKNKFEHAQQRQDKLPLYKIMRIVWLRPDR